MDFSLEPILSIGEFDLVEAQRTDPDFIKQRKLSRRIYSGADELQNKVELELSEFLRKNTLEVCLQISFPENDNYNAKNRIIELVTLFSSRLYGNSSFSRMIIEANGKPRLQIDLSTVRPLYLETVWEILHDTTEFRLPERLLKIIKAATYTKINSANERRVYEQIRILLDENKAREAAEFALRETQQLSISEQNSCDFLYSVGTAEAFALIPYSNCFYGAAQCKLQQEDFTHKTVAALKDLKRFFNSISSPRNTEPAERVADACEIVYRFAEARKRSRTLSLGSSASTDSDSSVESSATKLPRNYTPDLGLS